MRVRRTDGNVSRFVDRVSRVVAGPLVERLATQRRRDDSGHLTERLVNESTLCQVDIVPPFTAVSR